ncbi:MAG: M64 family metallopeptidase [Planctomycetota bacterium]
MRCCLALVCSLSLWGCGLGMVSLGVCQEPSGSPEAIERVDFDTYFTDKALRFELLQFGSQAESKTVLHRIVEEPNWPGNRKQPLFPFPYGRCSLQVYDQASGQLIYSFGFDTLYNEYATTKPAADGKWRSFPFSVRIPKPKSRFRVELAIRRSDHTWDKVWEKSLRPSNQEVRQESNDFGDTVLEMMITGDPAERVDLVFLAEGYSKSEQDKFRADADRMTRFMFEHEPYRSNRQRFNIRGVFRPSPESGVDEPDKRSYRNTALNASFKTLGVDRYLLTEDGHAIHQYAAQVPYDTVVILVNSSRYGGGAICLDFCICTVDESHSPEVFLHEFGHSFAYLADEYIGTSPYNEIYPEGLEPVEPNITRTLDRKLIKWSSMLTEEVPLPTTLSLAPRGTDPNELVGAFEGGGYVKKGMFRPQINCAMGSFSKQFQYCVVCRHAIERMIDYYAPLPSE